MASLWDYEGARVVVAGGGGAGMGAAAVTQLAELGAEIHVIDLREPPGAVASYHATDLLDPAATEAAIEDTRGRGPRPVQLCRASRRSLQRPRSHDGELRGRPAPG